MRLKVYQAPNIGAAMTMVRTELGPDALILATRAVNDGIEVTAALEQYETVFEGLRAVVGSQHGPARSDVALPPAPLNALLSAWLRAEAWWTLRLPAPVGLSLFAILRRPQ